MAVYDKILELIKIEIETDPTNRGYAGKKDEEIMELLTSSYTEQVISYVGRPSPLNRIMSGITGIGNLVSVKEVTDAKLFVAKEIL